MSRTKKRAPGGGGGKNWGKGGKRKAPSGQGGQANQQQQQQQQKGNDGWSTLDMNNKRFEAYYVDQGIVPKEEWEAFMDAFRQSLPTTFRFTAGKATTRQLITQMQERFVPELSGIEFEGEPVKPPQALSWYPEGLAWQVDVRKSVLRKQPDFQNFQKFLVNETAVGSLSRQEAVSMIPPLFLDVQPHHLVLDMCAAPGSKTAQLIEALHSPMTSSPEHYDPCPPGLIMANDSDVKRAYMLVHQATRLPSPNLCVTNVDAGAWPKIQVPWKAQDPSSSVIVKDLKFDRILGDVPCSGDGTLRKNVAIWKEWTTTNGQGLHPLQLRILLKGLGSLRPGGRMVYSTCSLNPLENEAVIAAAIRECGGKDGNIRLVDVSNQIPQLKRAKGLTTWKVCPGKGRHLFNGSANNMQPKQEPKAAKADKSAAEEPVEEDEDAAFNAPEQITQQDDAAEEQAPESEPAADSPEYRQTLPAVPWVDSWQRLKELDPSMANRVHKSLWPAGDEVELGLERCMRVYPHYQNTGGFFIAVLEKKGTADVESQSAGIARAVEAMDNGAVAPSYGASSKRALSPADDTDGQEDGAAKKAKMDEEQQGTGNIAPAAEAASSSKVDEQQQDTPAETPSAGPTAAERQTSKQKQRHTDSGYGLPGGTPYKEDPFEFIPITNEQVISIHRFFGLSSDFHSRNLIVRNADANPLRTIYLASTAVRGLITGGGAGMGVHRHFNPVKLRLLNAGTKAFARQESNKSGDLECKWRIIGDALPPIRPYLASTSIIPATLTDLAFLLSEYYPVFDRVPAGEFKETLKDRKMGSHVMDVTASEHDGVVLKEGIDLPIWRAGASVNLMLDKADRSALSSRIFGRDVSINARMKLESTKGAVSAVAPPAELADQAETAGEEGADKAEMLKTEVSEEQGAADEAEAVADVAVEKEDQ